MRPSLWVVSELRKYYLSEMLYSFTYFLDIFVCKLTCPWTVHSLLNVRLEFTTGLLIIACRLKCKRNAILEINHFFVWLKSQTLHLRRLQVQNIYCCESGGHIKSSDCTFYNSSILLQSNSLSTKSDVPKLTNIMIVWSTVAKWRTHRHRVGTFRTFERSSNSALITDWINRTPSILRKNTRRNSRFEKKFQAGPNECGPKISLKLTTDSSM